jgi:allantoin racemase
MWYRAVGDALTGRAGPRACEAVSPPREETVPFRVTIISPLQAAAADLARRQRRYGEHAGPGTVVTVVNLEDGPPALDTSGDVLRSGYAILRQGIATATGEVDAILVDCVFDPAVDELEEATGIPTFGPTRTTLPLIPLVASSFSIVARGARQAELLAATVERYGHGARLRSTRALGLAYEEAKRPEVFGVAMCDALRRVVAEDGAGAVLLGSTTMAITPDMVAAAGGVPLFMPGLVALRVMEQLWCDGLWPRRG